MQEIKKLLALKQKPVLQYGTVKIKEEEEMLFVERKYKKDRLILRINLTKETRQGIYPDGYQIMEEQGEMA